jgi:hypothetical protein
MLELFGIFLFGIFLFGIFLFCIVLLHFDVDEGAILLFFLKGLHNAGLI